MYKFEMVDTVVFRSELFSHIFCIRMNLKNVSTVKVMQNASGPNINVETPRVISALRHHVLG